jgi:hypothetical protein
MTMFVHTVFFWLKPGLSPEAKDRFVKGVNSLLAIKNLVHGSVGTPAETDRPVIDRSYSYGLLTVFENKAGHDAYQVDPIHLAFVESCKDCWESVKIYDFD